MLSTWPRLRAVSLVLTLLVVAGACRATPVPIASVPTGAAEATQRVVTDPPAAAFVTPRPTPNPGATPFRRGVHIYEFPLGYKIALLPGWRRSDLQSHGALVPGGDPEKLAADVFTSRAFDDESDALRTSAGQPVVGAASAYTAWVMVYRNGARDGTREFAQKHSQELGLAAVAVNDMTLRDFHTPVGGGRPATRMFWDWPVGGGRSYATYVEDDQGRMWVIGFYLATSTDDVPRFAPEEDLRAIVGSFEAAWLGR